MEGNENSVGDNWKIMLKTDLSKYDNSWYKPGSKAKIILWFLVNTCVINNYLPIPVSLKIWVLRLFGAQIGKGVMIKPKVNIKYPWFLRIGDFVWIGEEVWIDNYTWVSLENHTCISQGAMLLTGNHNYKSSGFGLMIGEIKLSEGAWIGAKAVVCPGVTVHSHAVLSVGSIATKDLDSYSIYQGNPAAKVRDRSILS